MKGQTLFVIPPAWSIIGVGETFASARRVHTPARSRHRKNGSDKKASPWNMIIETKNKSISYGSMGLSFLYVTTANKPWNKQSTKLLKQIFWKIPNSKKQRYFRYCSISSETPAVSLRKNMIQVWAALLLRSKTLNEGCECYSSQFSVNCNNGVDIVDERWKKFCEDTDVMLMWSQGKWKWYMVSDFYSMELSKLGAM